MPGYVPNHFMPIPYQQQVVPSIEIHESTISAQLIGKIIAMPQTKNDHINAITTHLKNLRADGHKSRQAVELLLNQNERNQLNLIHRLESAVFDAMHDGVSEDDIAAIDPTVENILRDVEDSLVH